MQTYIKTNNDIQAICLLPKFKKKSHTTVRYGGGYGLNIWNQFPAAINQLLTPAVPPTDAKRIIFFISAFSIHFSRTAMLNLQVTGQIQPTELHHPACRASYRSGS